MDYRLEVVVLPVGDVDCAKQFYTASTAASNISADQPSGSATSPTTSPDHS